MRRRSRPPSTGTSSWTSSPGHTWYISPFHSTRRPSGATSSSPGGRYAAYAGRRLTSSARCARPPDTSDGSVSPSWTAPSGRCSPMSRARPLPGRRTSPSPQQADPGHLRRPTGQVRPLYGGHAARAFFMAAKKGPMAVIQIFGRWSSNAIERYVQAAPMARAPGPDPGPAASRESERADGRSGRPGSRESGPTTGRPARRAASGPRPDPPGPPHMRPAGDDQLAARRPVHFVLHARTQRVHRPDPRESELDQALWKAPCGWRYGGTRYYRIPTAAADANRCRRCWRPPVDGEAGADSQVAAVSSASSSSGSSADRGRPEKRA